MASCLIPVSGHSVSPPSDFFLLKICLFFFFFFSLLDFARVDLRRPSFSPDHRLGRPLSASPLPRRGALILAEQSFFLTITGCAVVYCYSTLSIPSPLNLYFRSFNRFPTFRQRLDGDLDCYEIRPKRVPPINSRLHTHCSLVNHAVATVLAVDSRSS
ncbi:uncharacterized protein BO80DRAFT_78238 [Aspergillus ibericus CBS 121593]|uniref:Uncharacterized protein n=1 Tax=Aspergillus ibericus CBS 121593 TaxID=1448316 RepID=A0A395HDE8_9EURO|nr:hypothetical protein BO80DRAFT_78238 [Aspergillus ibericus CBS 121593]RAL05696.1 hypothetical protein BO80DRAFT_78238 [Aspergillus ibericus CBS 121593]